MPSKFDHKTAVIVGGTGDIGHATARLFVDAGVTVIITGRAAARVQAKAAALGSTARGITADPADVEQLRALFAAIERFDYLLLTLGTQAVTMPFTQLSEEDLLRGMNEKFLFYTRALRLAWGQIRESVTWLTGAAARVAQPGLSNYAAPNGALHAMIGSLAMELAPVRINCVAAGLTRTGFWRHLGMSDAACAAMYAGAEQLLPLRHVAEPEEIAHALFYVATNAYTTGTILDPNGGLHLGTISTAPAKGESFGNVR
ncbi:MAG: SDR family oxidoreductase [Vicinamibacteraceae bacterium]